MRVSVVTISYNQVDFLRECIDSVLDQDFPDLEYIVVDPGSTDGSRDLIDSYGSQIRRIYDKDDGPADGLNRGFACASGDIFAFLNADDVLLNGAVRYMVENFVAQPDLDVLCGCGYVIDALGSRQARVAPSRFTPWLYVHGAVTVFQQGVFFRSESFREVGGFNANNRTCWDGELFLDMALDGALYGCVPADVALFRKHDRSISGSGRLNDAYRIDSDRLFLKATGKTRGTSSRYYGAVARVLKFVADPIYLTRRMFARGLKSS